MFAWFSKLTLPQATGVFLGINVLTVVLSVGLCWLLGRLYASRRIFDRWEPLRRIELLAVLSAIACNTLISVAGWWLWIHGWIVLVERPPWREALDTLVMLLAMDCGMYCTHRLAHLPPLYRLFHTFHHRHETTYPLSLFVLHPLEVLGFGLLMLVFLLVYPMSGPGLVAYLVLNVLWGTLGHSGVEPFPSATQKSPGLSLLGTSTFHAEHHEAPGFNYGFYTLIWDRLFGTLHPDYRNRFLRLTIARGH